VQCSQILDGSISVTELGENNAVKTLKKRIQALKDSFGQNRTAKLWIEYMNMIDFCVNSSPLKGQDIGFFI
jgi:hypothetical protein